MIPTRRTTRTLEGSWVDCNAMLVARLEVNKAALKKKAQRLVRSSGDGGTGNIHHCGFFMFFLFQKEGGSPDLKKSVVQIMLGPRADAWMFGRY